MDYKIKKDKYYRKRGSKSKIYEINCARCKEHFCFYQKDGPGPLYRMYIDRIIGGVISDPCYIVFNCPKCRKLIGVYYIYKKEKRPALKLFSGAITKSIKE